MPCVLNSSHQLVLFPSLKVCCFSKETALTTNVVMIGIKTSIPMLGHELAPGSTPKATGSWCCRMLQCQLMMPLNPGPLGFETNVLAAEPLTNVSLLLWQLQIKPAWTHIPKSQSMFKCCRSLLWPSDEEAKHHGESHNGLEFSCRLCNAVPGSRFSFLSDCLKHLEAEHAVNDLKSADLEQLSASVCFPSDLRSLRCRLCKQKFILVSERSILLANTSSNLLRVA